MGVKEFTEKICENYRKILKWFSIELVDLKNAREIYLMLKDVNWDNVKMCIRNEDADWVNEEIVLKMICEIVCERDAKYRVIMIEKMLKNDDDVCYKTWILKNDKIHTIIADNIVLCTETYTFKLLAESFLDWKIQSDKRLKIVDVSVIYYNLKFDVIIDFEKTSVVVKSIEKNSSIFFHCREFIYIILIWSLDEFISFRDDELFKIVVEQNYMNMQQIDQFRLSVSFEKIFLWWNITDDDISQKLRNLIDDARWKLLEKWKIIQFFYETCW